MHAGRIGPHACCRRPRQPLPLVGGAQRRLPSEPGAAGTLWLMLHQLVGMQAASSPIQLLATVCSVAATAAPCPKLAAPCSLPAANSACSQGLLGPSQGDRGGGEGARQRVGGRGGRRRRRQRSTRRGRGPPARRRAGGHGPPAAQAGPPAGAAAAAAGGRLRRRRRLRRPPAAGPPPVGHGGRADRRRAHRVFGQQGRRHFGARRGERRAAAVCGLVSRGAGPRGADGHRGRLGEARAAAERRRLAAGGRRQRGRALPGCGGRRPQGARLGRTQPAVRAGELRRVCRRTAAGCAGAAGQGMPAGCRAACWPLPVASLGPQPSGPGCGPTLWTRTLTVPAHTHTHTSSRAATLDAPTLSCRASQGTRTR